MKAVWIAVYCMVLLSEGFLLTGMLYSKRNERLQPLTRNRAVQCKDPKLLILLPVYKVPTVSKTVTFFYELTKTFENVKCVFITTEKEAQDSGINPTADRLKQALKAIGPGDIYVFNSKNSSGGKPIQLNEFLRTKWFADQVSDDLFVAVYDADSRPDASTINEFFEKRHSHPRINVFQQNAIYNLNLGRRCDYSRLEAIYQTRWALGFEERNEYLSLNPGIRKYLVPYAYTVGHGMYLRSTKLTQLNGFPEPVEDIVLGMNLMLIGEPICPFVTKDHSEVPNDFRSLFLQSGNWIREPLHFNVAIANVKKFGIRIPIHRETIFLIRVALDFFGWIQYLLLFCLSILSRERLVLSCVTLVSAFILSLATVISLRKELNVKWLMVPKLTMLGMIRGVVRGLAPFSLLFQSCFGWYFDKETVK